ncbi:MAG: ERF family protein [Prevotella sp.]|nr:ERF family protein [Prevotella sp.]
MEALKKIQQELKAPKNQVNNFGGFNYRSAEDILEAVKPLLAKHDAEMILYDEIIEVGGRVYVKATVEISDGKQTIKATACAREPLQKTKMDEPQITGTASSYARKYALNGLFLIDDTKDPDTNEYKQQTEAKQQASEKKQQGGTKQSSKQQAAGGQKISKATVQTLDGLIKQTNSDYKKLLEFFKVGKLEDLTAEQARKCYAMLKSKEA